MSNLKALVWEIWIRHKIGLIAAAITPFLAAVLYPLLGDWLADWSDFRRAGLLPLMGSLIFLAFASSHGEMDRHFMGSGFPIRSFNLPVSTWRLVLVPIVLGVVALTLNYGIWVLLVLRPSGFDIPLIWPMAALAGCNLWLQAVGWTFGQKHGWGVLVLTGSFCLVAGAAFVSSGTLENGSFWLSAPVGGLGLAMLIACAVMLSYRSVEAARMGEPFMHGESSLAARFQFPPPPIRNPFSNKDRAQFWFEFRMFGWLLPCFFLAVIGFFLTLSFVNELSEKASVTMPIIMCFMFVAVTPMSGFEFAKSHFGAKNFEMTSFMAARPLSDQQVAHARLKMLFVSILFCLLILLIGQIGFLFLAGKWGFAIDFLQDAAVKRGAFEITLWLIFIPMFLLLICWALSGTAITLGLTGAKHIVTGTSAVSSIATMVVFFSAVFRFDSQENLKELVPMLPGIIGAITAVTALIFLGVGYLAGRKDVLAKDALARVGGPLLGLLTLCALCMFAFDLSSSFKKGWALFCTGLWFGAMLPVVGAPLAVHYNRHR